ncbi:hypothetical protein [Pectobacterium aroidearum]|uniref:hypothetical protein n=1 Tax=Pectobacterium aroidearum TaxID=1201031 RepID=UPI00301AEA5C
MKNKPVFTPPVGSPYNTAAPGLAREGMTVTEPQACGCGRGDVSRLMVAVPDTTQLIAVCGGMDDAARDAFTSAILSSCNVSVVLNTGADTPLN